MKKKIIAVLCTIITVIPLVLSTPKADNSYTTHTTPTVTSNGQYYSSSSYFEDLVSYTLGPADITIPVSNATSFTFVYEFKDTYDGYINLSLTAVNSFAWNTTYFYCEGCTLIQQPNMSNVSNVKTFGLHFQSAKKISFTVIHETNSSITADKIFYDYSAGTTTTFSITDSNFNLQPNVADDLHHLQDRFDYYIPGMSENLSNLANDVDNIYDNIGTLLGYVDDVEQYLTNLKGYVDGIEGYIDNIETTLTNIYNRVNTNLPNINTNINQILSLLKYNIPNWKIPAYMFFNMAPSSINQTNQTSYTNNTITYGNNNIFTAYYSINKSYYDNVFTVYNSFTITPSDPIVIAWYSNNTASFGEAGHPSSSIRIIPEIPNTADNGVFIQDWGIDTSVIGFFHLHYITLYSTTTRRVEVEFNPTITATGPGANSFVVMPLYFGSYNNVPDEVRQLLGLEYDNTYTRLLQQLVNGVSGSYDTSQYDQYEQTIDGLNDSLKNRFDGSETGFQNNINNILNPDNISGDDANIFTRFKFGPISNVFNDFITDIFTIAPSIKYTAIFLLLLLVLGVFI